ncbi:MAG: MSCRAMM family adhesin SdrC [Polyangiaceae bacterium]|nr:MSCRAMM family adhesin SdrC [Polyangiaceae bacterium]
MATAVACGSSGTSSNPLQPTAAYPNCTETADYWRDNPDAWPITTITLGALPYSQNQLLQILAQPTDDNGLVDLAQAETTAKLNIAEGADDSLISTVMMQADALIDMLLPPPIGVDVLPQAATATLVAALDDFNTGAAGPGLCKSNPFHGNCAQSVNFWLENPDAWPVNSLTLGSTKYPKGQLRQILSQDPDDNGLLLLEQLEIAVKLSIAAGADDGDVADLLQQVDAFIDGLVPPPVGADELPKDATADLVAALSAFLDGDVGPGICRLDEDAGTDAGEDASTDAGSDASTGDGGNSDGGSDASTGDGGNSDGGSDASTGDGGSDAGNNDASTENGDASSDAGTGDAGRDASADGGSESDSGITL